MENFYGFIIAFIVLMILEIATPGTFFFFSLSIAALLTSFATFFIKEMYMLLIIMAVLSIVVFLVLKKLDIFKLSKEDVKTNADRYIGQKVKVISIIESKKVRVKIYGEEWTGISETEFSVGDEAVIEKIEGITLYLKKVAQSEIIDNCKI